MKCLESEQDVSIESPISNVCANDTFNNEGVGRKLFFLGQLTFDKKKLSWEIRFNKVLRKCRLSIATNVLNLNKVSFN